MNQSRHLEKLEHFKAYNPTAAELMKASERVYEPVDNLSRRARIVSLVTNTPKLARYAGIFAGTLVALFITFEAPYSGMSINPARTVASALPSGVWTAGWIYFVAPIGGMLLAVEIYRALRGLARIGCAKLNHHTHRRCIFCGIPGNPPHATS